MKHYIRFLLHIRKHLRARILPRGIDIIIVNGDLVMQKSVGTVNDNFITNEDHINI